MTESNLVQRLKGGESEELAFVESLDDVLPIAKTVCSFLNSDMGGVVACGVDLKGKVVGVRNAAKAARELESELKSMVTPPALFSVAVEKAGAESVVVIDAPAGRDKPYVVEGGVWLRRKAKTAPADAVALRSIFDRRAQENERWERRLSPNMKQSDLETDRVLKLRDEAMKRSRFSFTGKEKASDILRTLGLMRIEGYTQGCDVLFSALPSARHPQCRVQFLKFESDETDDTYKDYRWFDGPLPKVAEDLFKALENSSRNAPRFRARSMEREEQPQYSGFALREALVNALVHRDYEPYSGGVRVSVFPSRIEFWNTGRLPDGLRPSDLARRHPSLPANPDIANVFYLRGLMERAGRGTTRIVRACKEIGAPPPKWSVDPTGVTLVLHAAIGHEAALEAALNERQRTFVDTVPVGEAIPLAEYRERFAGDISDRQARRELMELEDYRFVKKEGAGRATVYRRIDG